MPKQPASIPDPEPTDSEPDTTQPDEPQPTDPPPVPRSAMDDPSHPLHHLRNA